jgi:molecular chaperone DnaK (HSP70)
MNEKLTCECGKVLSIPDLSRHRKNCEVHKNPEIYRVENQELRGSMRKPIEAFEQYDGEFRCDVDPVRELESYTAQLEKKLKEAVEEIKKHKDYFYNCSIYFDRMTVDHAKTQLEECESFLKSIEQEESDE